MKNITDYFTSPTKSGKKSVEERPKDGSEPFNNSENAVASVINNSEVVPDVEKSEKISSRKSVSKKRKKKARICRSPDPAVNNVADLLSSNLNFLSPDNMKLQNIIEVEDNDKRVEIKQPTNENRSKSKPNAFQFLMDSRHKSIGTNSPGKELENDIQENDPSKKEVLAARRNILNDWAEKKGASKRKRIEEELDEVISHKLEKRAKRLKKLLKSETDSHRDDKPKTNRKKRIKRLSSSSESGDSSDLVQPKVENDVRKSKTKVNFKGCINKDERNKENASGDRISTTMKAVAKDEIHLKEDKKSEQHSNIALKSTTDESSQDSAFLSPKSKESKQSLLSFFGITSTANTSSKSDNLDNDYSEEYSNNSVKSIKIKETGSDVKVTPAKKRKKTKEKKKKPSNHSHKNSEENLVVIEDDSRNQDSVICEENRRSKRNKSNKTPMKAASSIDESSQDGDFTPRRLRSWRMKIKIDMEEQRSEADVESKGTEKSIYVDDNSDAEEIEIDSDSESDLYILEEEEEDTKKRPEKRSVKMAPIFVKAAPKPKVDPEVLEARKQFLLSGMPSSLKRVMEKQQSMEEKECVIFPSISHVQQKCDSKFWDLQKPNLSMKPISPLKLDNSNCACEKLTKSCSKTTLQIKIETEKITDIKSLLDKIKADNPDYPVFKSYRHISEKNCKQKSEKKVNTSLKKKRGRKSKRKSLDNSVEVIEPEKVEVDLTEYAMWTDKYKAMSSEEIIGNTDAVKNLRNWLETWKNFSKEINSKKKRRNSNSSSEFETTDCDSRDSTRLPGNTMVLGGPCGCGKSTAVYAICNELGFNVIEINASSKRTGKRLLQELQEATQSHQVRKNNSQNIQNLFSKTEKDDSNSTETNRKMCVLFVEDIDIVFDQDDGFINALAQLITTSKRPMILTTTDYDSVFVQKFLSQYEHISFAALSSYSLATWLQVVCLVEGILVDQNHIGTLLEYNKGDVRKTLLQLQFWIQSGGEILKNKMPMRLEHIISKAEEMLSKDDDNNCVTKVMKNSTTIHRNCIRSFETFEYNSFSYLPYGFSLGLFWWNVPNILGIPSFAKQRIEKFKSCEITSLKKKNKRSNKYSLEEKMQLQCLTDLYDSVCFTDTYFRSVAYGDNAEPHVKNFNCVPRDSMELNERLDCYDIDIGFVYDVSHYLINGNVHEFGNEDPGLDVTMPNKSEQRWRAKQHVCEDVFKEAVPLSWHIDRKAISLDYLPCLRDISRSETQRSASNIKRGNRFRNYLRGLGVNCGESTAQIANKILKEV